MVIKCEDLCKDCGTHFCKNPKDSGDYNIEGVLLRFCPKCGQMLPYLFIDYDKIRESKISNNTKKRVGTVVAKKNKLNYAEMYLVIKDLKNVDKKKEFVVQFRVEIKKVFDVDMDKKDLNVII